jgi:hypothetical protein
MMPIQIDKSILEMAIIGYEAERQRVDNAIAEIRAQLGHRPVRSAGPAVDGAPRQPRQMSAAAKERIADAQRKRWAAFHAKAGKPAKSAAVTKAPKRTLSPERRAALAANLAKARAARAAKRAAAE